MAFNTPLLAVPSEIEAVQGYLMSRYVGDSVQMININAANAKPDSASTAKQAQSDVNNIAVVRLHGLLTTRHGEIGADCTSLLSYEKLSSVLTELVGNESIDAIVLDGNTGGGSAVGCHECAELILSLRERKPIYGIVNYATFSAGYYLMSSCTEIYISKTASLGSIGVIWSHFDYSAAIEKDGINITVIHKGDQKNDLSPYEALSQDAKERIESSISLIYDQFVSHVSSARGIPVESVISTQAGIFRGQSAIDAGLADNLMTPQDAINDIAQRHPFTPSNTSAATQQQLKAKSATMRMIAIS